MLVIVINDNDNVGDGIFDNNMGESHISSNNDINNSKNYNNIF